jgi:hypothetical protein
MTRGKCNGHGHGGTRCGEQSHQGPAHRASCAASCVQSMCNIARTNSVAKGQQELRDRSAAYDQNSRSCWSGPYGHSPCWWSGTGPNCRPSALRVKNVPAHHAASSQRKHSPLCSLSWTKCGPKAGQRVALYQIIAIDGATVASTVTYLLAMVAIVPGVLVLSESAAGSGLPVVLVLARAIERACYSPVGAAGVRHPGQGHNRCPQG